MSKLTKYFLAIIILALVGIAGLGYKIYNGHYNIWLADYLFNSPTFEETDGIVDIIYVAVDHWEPGGNINSVNRWMTDYPALADRHYDSDSVKVQHTFYYPVESFRGFEVDSLVKLCSENYGDIEVHLHHKDDNSESLRKLFNDGIDSLQAHGALISPDGEVHFSFVHGNFALDNSRDENGVNYCGVNNELDILLELGCYCDCTFPSLQQTSQPSLINKIYYAKDDPLKPKSYDTGIQSHVGIEVTADQLMIFEGSQMINWSDWRFNFHPTIDDGDIYNDMHPSPERFDVWLKANVHILDRPNWVFVRSFTHGAATKKQALEANLGQDMDNMLTAIEKKYKNEGRYRLHYMTVREAYNVVKAAEKGLNGNPNDYRDFIIKPYIYSSLNTE